MKNSILVFLVCTLFYSKTNYAQNNVDEEFVPAIIVISTFHLVNDSEKDFSDWKDVEQEYFDKITNKNEFILGSGVYTHIISPDDSEVLFVNVYGSWEDIEYGKERTEELIEEGWAYENERDTFFENQNSYYNGNRQDEIAISLPYQKDLVTNSTEPLILHIRKNKTGSGGSGYTEFFDNVIMNNDYIKGYYTYRQLYGNNAQDAVEAAIYESLADFEAAYDESVRLAHEHWPDEKERKAFFKEFRKIFNGHGDFIYQNVPSLAK